MTTSTPATNPALPDSYLELFRVFPLRPIRTSEDLDRASAVVKSLVVRMGSLTPEECDYLDVLSDLVEKYEASIYPEPSIEPHVMLRELITFGGCSQAEVARETGISESVLSEILRGKRKMGRKTIETFAIHFHVHPGVFFNSGEAVLDHDEMPGI